MLLLYYDENGNIIEEDGKVEERYIYYISDLYNVFSNYDINLDGVVNKKDAKLTREIFESRYGFTIVNEHIYFEEIPTRR